MALNAKQDAENIHKALKGLNDDEKALIAIVARRPNFHLQKVREEYEKLYETDLVNYVESQTSYNFKKLLAALLKSRGESRAVSVYNAIKGTGTDEQALIDVLIHCSDNQLEDAKQVFRQKYNVSMDEFIKGDTTGDFEKILVHAIKGKRETGVKKDQIDSDAEKLYKAGEAAWGTDEDAFIGTLTTRSFEHLVEVNKKYTEKYKKTLVDAIKSETGGWFETALISCVKPPAEYWAERCKKAIYGLGTDDALLVRCFSENSKPFLAEVAKAYEKLYKVTLLEDVKGDTSGDYRDLLNTLLDLPESERKLY